jgi:hypothetical protein
MKNRMATMIKANSRVKLRGLWPAFLVLGSLSLPGSVTAFAQDVAGQDQATQANGQRTDGQIEMDVVHALDANAALKQDWISAGTVQGEVTLSGTSASEDNRRLAESIAKNVNGVTKVVNDLKVGDPQQAQNASDAGQAPDDGQYPDSGQQQADNNYPQQQPQYPAQQGGQYPQQQQGGQYPQEQGGGQYPQQQAGGPGNYPPQQPQYPAGSQGGYAQPQPYGQGNGNYPPQQAQAPLSAEPPSGPVTLPAGQLLKLRTSEPLDSKRAKVGTPVEFTVVRDVFVKGVIAVPRGAVIEGHVVEDKNAGAVGGRAQLGLQIETLELGGEAYPLTADAFTVKSPNKAGRTAGNAIGGALLGALIGGAVGGGEGAAIGAGAGAAGGTAASAATPGPRVWIPAEALMDFHINAPLTVQPVSPREAQRLAQNAPPPSQRPTLYRRGPYGSPYGYPPPPPPPGYYDRPY